MTAAGSRDPFGVAEETCEDVGDPAIRLGLQARRDPRAVAVLAGRRIRCPYADLFTNIRSSIPRN